MGDHILNRRAFLLTIAAAASVPTMLRASETPGIHVLKDPGCGCCGAWMDIVARSGFRVTYQDVAGEALTREKLRRGIPAPMMSCHTAEVGGYVVEGHVPVTDIRRLLAERPDAVGLAVPGMPFGSPGMGPEDAREAYEVHLILRDGSSRIFARYPAA